MWSKFSFKFSKMIPLSSITPQASVFLCNKQTLVIALRQWGSYLWRNDSKTPHMFVFSDWLRFAVMRSTCRELHWWVFRVYAGVPVCSCGKWASWPLFTSPTNRYKRHTLTQNVVTNTGSPANCRADSRFAPSQWETALLCNDVSYWLSANLE